MLICLEYKALAPIFYLTIIVASLPLMMKKLTFILPLLAVWVACKQPSATTQNQVVDTTAQTDPHSFAKANVAVVKHLDLTIKVDFAKQQIGGKATWQISNIAQTDTIIFDDNGLHIDKITLGTNETPTTFKLYPAVKYLGTALHIHITPDTKLVNIYYTTGKDAAALQWLTPLQTAGKKLPFLFTQSESILARTWVPCQDSPGIRFTYDATVTVPANLVALMSAVNPQSKNATGVYHFKQSHAISSYLLALSVGDIAFKAVDYRTGVYAEPSVLSKAAYEFADMGKMVNAAEKLYGPYRWGRYDLMILPPSFPFGGMENPNLTFATPTIIAGDRSLVSLVAHELAHSWSGNLVTNATWNDMWLNEGFTNYFERRIDEAVYGKDEADMQKVMARQALDSAVAELGQNSPDTRLKVDYTNRDPDDAVNDIPYEKGCYFLLTIESIVGRQKFDAFLMNYFNSHAFHSRSTEQFLADLNKNLLNNDTALIAKIEERQWVYGAGIPNNIVKISSAKFMQIDTLLSQYGNTHNPKGLSQSIKSSNEKHYFISNLPKNLSVKDMAAIDHEFGFTQSNNTDIQLAWYVLCIRHHYTVADASIAHYLINNGRRGHIVPIYQELIKTPGGKQTAKRIYKLARPSYHPLTQGTLDKLVA